MKINYRPEIDGLRAIAVLIVILYHAKITIFGREPFKGGFIGVDIFFVISGYLITSIILKELTITGSFSYKNFYERRIRRIIPALVFVIFLSLPFAWYILLPSSFVDFSKSIIYSLGFSSNFYFHETGQIYGDQSSLLKPFLHTWSLSVEEQYYILFPVIFFFIFRYFRKYLLTILVIGFILSFQMADWGSRYFPSATFYFLHTRMFELLAGSILAYFEITSGRKSQQKNLNLIFPSIGLFLIVHSFIFFNIDFHHPSFITILPIIGVCLIIWFAQKDELVTKILSSRPFVTVGLISYSLYLWHYPLFSFYRFIKLYFPLDIIGKFFAILILLVISFFSYRFVELPFRNKKLSFKKILTIIGFFLLIIIIFNFYVIKKKGFVERLDKFTKIHKNYNPDNVFLRNESQELINFHNKKKDFEKTKFKVLIIGDSHADDLNSALQLNSTLFKNIDFLKLPFELENNKKESLIKNSDYIIFSYRWDEDKLKKFKNDLDLYRKINKNIAITSSGNEYPLIGDNLYTLLDYNIFFSGEKIDYFGLKKKYFENRIVSSNSNLNNLLLELSKKEKLKYLNKDDYLCELSKQKCYYVDDNGKKLFYDYGHYTIEGAKFFGNKIYQINWLKLN
jgi:peptidoglycan/LPS O-acetylase OafA/YrhL